jgi:Domain of unknown function (DU1801)
MIPMDPTVRAVFDATAPEPRAGMHVLRQLIFDVAARLPKVGRIDESLRWGVPAYLTSETRSGSTLRIGAPRAGGFALYCNCQTSLIADFRDLMGEAFCYEGNRAVVFRTAEELDAERIGMLVARALTWHQRHR